MKKKQSELLPIFYRDTYEPLALRDSSINTRRLYGVTLRHFNRFCGGKSTLDDLNDRKVSGFVTWRKDSGVQHNTAMRDLDTLLALWRWSHKKGYVTNYPDITQGKRVKRSPIAWQREELERLFVAAQREERRVGDVEGSVWWTALLLVLWDTGERIGAAIALHRSDIDLDGGWVNFPAEFRKGGRSDNTISIANDTVEALKKLFAASPSQKAFPFPYHHATLYNRYARLLKRAGLPSDRGRKFHAIRKSAASHLEAAGGDATVMLGHASRRTTESYLDPRIVPSQKATDILFRPF